MKILSLSMKKDLFEQFEKARKDLSYKNRSETLRHGINLMLEESQELERLRGHIDTILFLMHSKHETKFLKIIRKNEDMIKTHIHNNLCNDKCLEIFVMHGPAEKIKELYNQLKNKKFDYIKLLVP